MSKILFLVQTLLTAQSYAMTFSEQFGIDLGESRDQVVSKLVQSGLVENKSWETAGPDNLYFKGGSLGGKSVLGVQVAFFKNRLYLFAIAFNPIEDNQIFSEFHLVSNLVSQSLLGGTFRDTSRFLDQSSRHIESEYAEGIRSENAEVSGYWETLGAGYFLKSGIDEALAPGKKIFFSLGGLSKKFAPPGFAI